jgi:hypothetical protein
MDRGRLERVPQRLFVSKREDVTGADRNIQL